MATGEYPGYPVLFGLCPANSICFEESSVDVVGTLKDPGHAKQLWGLYPFPPCSRTEINFQLSGSFSPVPSTECTVDAWLTFPPGHSCSVGTASVPCAAVNS